VDKVERCKMKEEKLSGVLMCSYTILNFDINLGKATFGEILILIWGKLLKCGILMLTLGGLHERHAVQRGIWVPTQNFLWD
jgi:hypothetical protein